MARAAADPLRGSRVRQHRSRGRHRRDLSIDIWLLEALLDPTDLVTVRSAAIETFHRRQNHRWPPVVTSSDSWVRDYAGLITEYPDAPATSHAAVDYLARLIERIDAAQPEASDGE